MDPSSDMEVEYIPETQEQQQPTPSPPEERDPNLWGYLLRYPGNKFVPKERYDLRKDCPVVTIGRDPRNTICIPHPMSNVHATMRWEGVKNGVSHVTIEDQGSKNHTYIESVKINTVRLVKDEAEISFSCAQVPPPGNPMKDFRFIYHDLASPARGVLVKLKLAEVIGSGCFGKVYKAYDRKDGSVFAVKSIQKDKSVQEQWNNAGVTVISEQRLVMEREVAMLKEFAHPNILSMRDHFWNADGSIDIVLDYMDGGDLFDFVRTNNGLSERMTKHLARQLCDALAFIHSKNVAHRDLKPENILLSKDRPPILKIADFGLSKFVDAGARLVSICGTPMFLAPEFALHRLHGTGYGILLDCFALGGIIYGCLTILRALFSNLPEGVPLMEHVTPDRTIDTRALEQVVLGSDKEGYPIYLSSAGRSFVLGLLESDPERRLTMAQALQHEWFAPNQADAYTLPPTSTTCEELTSSLQEVTMKTAVPAPTRNATATPASSQNTEAEAGSFEVDTDMAPGLTRLKNKGRALERQSEVLDRALRSQQLFGPSEEMISAARLAATAGPVAPLEACGVAGGSNKRKYSAVVPTGNPALRRTASPGDDSGTEDDSEEEPAPKKGKAIAKSLNDVQDSKMNVSPRKLVRRVGR
ncbi:kinase-like domain-containing protein [Mycena polygramma]|nr:kinase-like domain-containing protein [Mycena polygramma]